MKIDDYHDIEEFDPQWITPCPGELIQKEIEARDLSQADLAARMSTSKKHLNQVIKGSASVSPDLAIALERALGTSAQVWLRVEADWRANQIRSNAKADLERYVAWMRKFPTDVLRTRGVVSNHDDETTMVDKILRFFGVSDPNAFDRVWLAPQASYKRSTAFEIDPYSTALWLQLAVRQAGNEAKDAPEYSSKRLRAVASKLPGLTRQDMGTAFQKVREELRQSGVILVFVPEVVGTRLSGVSLWLPSNRPMIALTNRYKFADSVWFSLAHEIAHVLLHLKRTTFLDGGPDDLSDHLHYGGDTSDHEAAANDFAENLFLQGLDRERIRNISTRADLDALASELNISVGMLAGQYGNATGNWGKFGRLRKRTNLSEELAAR